MEKPQALFLDRDGTLIKHIPYLSDPHQVELLFGVREALHLALKKNILLFLFTNQSGVGRGWFTLEDVHKCNEAMLNLLALPRCSFTEICIAPEAPTDTPIYRKPSPRFIIEMIKKYNLHPHLCYMIGDQPVDMDTAKRANINGVYLQSLIENSTKKNAPYPYTFPSLYDFINYIL